MFAVAFEISVSTPNRFQKKRKHSLSLSPSLRVPFLQILLFPRNVVGAKKGGEKKKKQGEKASHVLSGRIRGRVQQPFLGE